MIEYLGELHYSLEDLMRAFDFDTEEETLKSFKGNVRSLAWNLEHRVNKHFIKGENTKGDDHVDIIGPEGERIEVRSLTNMVYFSPSAMRGAGRKFEEEGFLKRLSECSFFVVCNMNTFPIIKVWKISSDKIKTWYENGILGSNASLSRNNFSIILNRPMSKTLF